MLSSDDVVIVGFVCLFEVLMLVVFLQISLTTGGFQCLVAFFLLEIVIFLKPQYYWLILLLPGQTSSAIRKFEGTCRLREKDCSGLTAGRGSQHE